MRDGNFFNEKYTDDFKDFAVDRFNIAPELISEFMCSFQTNLHNVRVAYEVARSRAQEEIEGLNAENERLMNGMSAMLIKNNETIDYLNKECGKLKQLLKTAIELFFSGDESHSAEKFLNDTKEVLKSTIKTM